MRTPWLHQEKAHQDVLAAIAAGERRIVLTSPTGGGKTDMMIRLAKHYLDQHKKVILYTDRKMLLEQASRVFGDAGLEHGTRAAGIDDDLWMPFQISSIQTEHSRVTKRKTWELHAADLVLIDEPHKQTGKTVEEILAAHYAAGAVIVGPTATPMGLAHMYDCLIQAGVHSQLRDCGSLLPARFFGPDEPDFKAHKIPEEGEVTEPQARKVMMNRTLFGRVKEWFDKLNPERKPTVLFAPGVPESLWFAEQFEKAGVPAAHIDGTDIWRRGELQRSTPEARQELLDASRTGAIQVLCNRFVLREGLDLPWLAHGILATVFGSLQSYLQGVGRLLRAFPGLQYVTIQDHGGNWWRWDSPNMDRRWNLRDDGRILSGMRADDFRNGKKKQPFRCPGCGMIWPGEGKTCARQYGGCGYQLKDMPKRSRPVVTKDGVLKEMVGDVYKPRVLYARPDGPKKWEGYYWRSRSKRIVKKMVKGVEVEEEKGWNGTFRQAYVLFARENYFQWPDTSWPLMPIDPMDSFSLVADVPRDRLR